jgi:hypothetical protein
MTETLVTVGAYQSLPEAELARVLLEVKEIRAFLIDAETVSTLPFLGNALGWIKLQVPQAQAEAAFAALEGMRGEPGRLQDDDAWGSDATVCLECGAKLPPARQKCSACGWSYAVESESHHEDQDREEDRAGSGREERTSVMDILRSLKFLLVLLCPILLIGFLIVWLDGAIFSGKRGLDGGECGLPSPDESAEASIDGQVRR